MQKIFLNKYVRLGKVNIDLATFLAALIIIAGAALRFALILNNWPTTNSDEATVGLMALHISHRHDFPVFFYGEGWEGSLEAYVGAALFFIFGPNVFALRLGVLLFFIAFLVCMFALARLLYSKGLALVTLLMLGIGSPEIFFRSILALAGRAETPLFGALIMLLSIWIGLASQKHFQASEARFSWRFVFLYALWGLVAGAAFWNDALAGSFILMGGLFLLICCRRTLRTETIASLLLGLVIGLLPFLLHDLLASDGHKGFLVFGFLAAGGGSVYSVLAQFAASFLVTLPVATGGTGVCTVADARTDPWPLTAQTSPSVIQCTVMHGIWATVMASVWLIAVIMELRILVRLWLLRRGRKKPGDAKEQLPQVPGLLLSPLEQRAILLRYARLMLLGSAGLSWLVFALSGQSLVSPWNNNRYLIGLSVATPALIWPLWKAITAGINKPLRLPTVMLTKALSVVILLAFIGALVKGTVDTFNQIPPSDVVTQQHQELANTLVRMHLKHIYSEYWTCDLVIFLTKEQVICSVLDEQLNPGVNRYAPYTAIVARDPSAAYVFPMQSPQAQALARRAERSGQHYLIVQFDNYIVYQPIT